MINRMLGSSKVKEKTTNKTGRLGNKSDYKKEKLALERLDEKFAEKFQSLYFIAQQFLMEFFDLCSKQASHFECLSFK